MQSHQSPKPLENLAKALLAAVKHHGDHLKTMNAILQFPKDQHGNILAGLDNSDFEIWNSLLKDLVPLKVFGPILIPTNPRVIRSLLSHLKIEPQGFQGNATSAQIESLTGIDNIFSAKDPVVHSQHKTAFKTFLEDDIENIAKAKSIVDEWLVKQLNIQNEIDDESLSQLCSKIMLRFLLCEEAANNQPCVDALILMKTHFIDLTVLKKLNAKDRSYSDSFALIKKQIASLFLSRQPSYVQVLKNKNYTLDQITSDVCSLLMVGFDNLRSALASVLIQLSRHPEEAKKMRSEMIFVDNAPFVAFNPDLKIVSVKKKASSKFFEETTRLAPPVWLQARKNGDTPIDITYVNDQGESCSFSLPPRSNILIPILHLARQLQDGNSFQTGRDAAAPLPLPFSTGPNACPGRNIAYTTLGLVVGGIIESGQYLTLTTLPTYSPRVSFTLENIRIKVSNSELANEHSNEILGINNYHQFYNHMWAQDKRTQQKSLVGGLAATLLIYYAADSLGLAVMSGTITATLLLLFLTLQQEKTIDHKLDDIRCSPIR